MKKFSLIISLAVLPLFLFSQTTIRMEKEGGIYKIKCKINGAPMKMYFDTGATNVSISLSTALYLFENDLITKEDIKGTTKISTADGTIRDNMLINLKDVELAGLHLRNVQAVVSSSLHAPLLLGQSAIQKLGKITMNGNILTIHNQPSIGNTRMTQKDREDIRLQMKQLRDNRKSQEDDYKIIELANKIETSYKLNEFELFCKTMSLCNLFKYNEALPFLDEWIKSFADNTNNTDYKMKIYFESAECNILGDGDKELGMDYFNRCLEYHVRDTSAHYFWYKSPFIVGYYCQCKNEGYNIAIMIAKASLKHFMNKYNITLEMINKNNCQNSDIALSMHHIASSYSHQCTWLDKNGRFLSTQHKMNYLKNRDNYSIMAAKTGDKESIEICRDIYNIDYKRILTKEEINNLDFGF